MTFNPITETELADLLERAADAVETYGHNKCSWAGDDGSVCVRGALAYAATGDPHGLVHPPFEHVAPQPPRVYARDSAAIDAVGAYLGLEPERLLTTDHWNIAQPLVRWNDADERTAYDVIDALRGTAKEIRNRA